VKQKAASYIQPCHLWYIQGVRATMRIVAARNMQGIRLHLHEPFVTVEVDGLKTVSQTVACDYGGNQGGGRGGRGGEGGGQGGGGLRQYVFNVSQSSVIRLSVCDWTSGNVLGGLFKHIYSVI